MTTEKTTPLRDAFLEDHQKLSQGLYKLMQALQTQHDIDARKIADELDRVAGPHIEFEENVLYPAVAQAEGQGFALRLHGEHNEAVKAIRTLLEGEQPTPLPEETRQAVIAGVRTGLEHAESCGTLISHLTAMPPGEQAAALERLLGFRRLGHRWTELPDAAPEPQRPAQAKG